MRFDSCDYRPRSIAMRASIAIAALAILAGCGGGGGGKGGDDHGGKNGGNPPPPGMSISEGDNQTIAQFWRATLLVRVADDSNHPIPGKVVTFTAPGLTVDPLHSTATTDDSGIAFFLGSFHKTGNIAVTASAEGFTPVTFYITVTQNPYKFDGYYDCAGYGTYGVRDKYYLRVIGTQVTAGDDQNPFRDVIYDPVGGSLHTKQRYGLDYVRHWDAMFTVDAAGVATLTGTVERWLHDLHFEGPPSQVTCTRQ